MQRSLFAGVSGLTNHQAILDVTANNLANVSTPGFKGSRVTFSTAMNQTQSAGTAPGTQSGGTNPRQVGLGVTTGSVDVDMRQGALLSTGRSLDLAIQGNGFFRVTRTNAQDGTYYTRVGNFGFDENDDLVDLATGLQVNGVQDNVPGAISLTQYRAINATATSQVTFQGNLDANSGSLRGAELNAVLPLVEASSDRSSFSTATDTTLLKNLTIFRGEGTDPGQNLSGAYASNGTLTTSKLISDTAVVTGGRVECQITVPAADYSTDNLSLEIVRGGVVIGQLVVDQDLTAFASSSTAYTFTLESSSKVNTGDVISIDATRGNGGNLPTGSFSVDTAVMTDLAVFGTKPNGEAYGGKISIDPWNETVSNLIDKVNSVLTHGTRTFGAVALENGNLVAKGLEPGDGFSLFIGEDDKLPLGASETASKPTAAPLDQLATLTTGVDALPTNTAQTAAGSAGALRPSFTLPPIDLSSQIGKSMTITVKINGSTAGTIVVPSADYSVSSPTFTLQSFPQVTSSDLISYEFTGDLDLAPTADSSFGIHTTVAKLTEQATVSAGPAALNLTETLTAATPTDIAETAIGNNGRLSPRLTVPAVDLSTQTGELVATVTVNGTVAGTITIPAADYSGSALADRIFTLPNMPYVTSADTVGISFAATGTFDLTGEDVDIATDTTDGGFVYRGVSSTGIGGVTMTTGGLIRPTFTMPASDLSGQVGRTLKVSVKINGSERASISIPPADYRGGADRTFTIPNLPHVKAGDVVTFDLTGTLDLGAEPPNAIGWSTQLVSDADSTAITQDRDSTGAPNGQPDMFEDDPTDPVTTDVNRWQYSIPNNTNFDWYRIRFSPDVVISTIDVYDTNGTKHNLEARFFKTGTKVDEVSGSRSNVWDMIANIDPAEGTLTGDLVTGIQFDNLGRYTGDASLGSTARGTGLDANGFRGQPDNNRLEVTWNASGPTQLQAYLGATNGTDGLTGFGSASTAAAISQDGFTNGSLESISVQGNGEMKGLYSNGQSQTIGEIQVFTFRNPAGLLSAGNNLWQPSSNSGQETPRTPGNGGAGLLTAGSLEGSNVDIASEFTRLITAQRGFQVNARVIQTTDQILQELAGLVR